MLAPPTEFSLGAMAGLAIAFPARDAEGRPLGESHAPEDRREGVRFDLKSCGYPGSRHGRPMNTSALTQVLAHWDEILSDVNALRALYLGHTGQDTMSLWRLWEFGSIATALPAYLLRRAKDPSADGAIPARVAGMFKAMQGIFLTAQHMSQHGTPLDAVPTPEEFFAYAEANQVFIAQPSGHACSGPRTLIEEFVRVTISGDATLANDPAFASLLGDPAPFFRYADALVTLELLWILMDLQNELLLDGVAPSRDQATSQYIQAPARALLPLVGALLAPRLAPLTPGRLLALDATAPGALARASTLLVGWLADAGGNTARAPELALVLMDYLLLEREALVAFTAIQHAIERALGRAESPSLTTQDLDRVAQRTVRGTVADLLGVEVRGDTQTTRFELGDATLSLGGLG